MGLNQTVTLVIKFIELSYFHVAEGLPPDLAHDVLEGIAVDAISDIVGALVGKNIFHCQNSIV